MFQISNHRFTTEVTNSRDQIDFFSPGWFGFCISVLLVAAAWVVILLLVHANNPRLLPSWHGFLHAAIATRFPSDTIPPENPFFAGERLPYYWVYQFLGFTVARVFETDLLHAFQSIALMSLVVLVIAGGLIGYKCFGSTATGLLIGYLALVGLNPLGPGIALAKHFLKGTPLYSTVPAGESVDTVFVSNQIADDWMTQPLLPALYISSDWRHGQNLVWFFDISSRAPALALIMVLLFLLLGSQIKLWKGIAISLVAALVTALNPIGGFAISGSLVGAVIFSRMISPRHHGVGYIFGTHAPFFLAFLCVMGVILALPAYYHLFALNKETFQLTPSVHYGFLKMAALSANFLLLVPLAIFGSWKARSEQGIGLWTMTMAGIVLLLAVSTIHLKLGNEHNLTNVAQCLFAVPAGAWIIRGQLRGERFKRSFLFLFALLLPTTIATLFSYTGRPSVPLGFHGQTLKRVPENAPLESLYAWIRKQTPKDAVFIADPKESVKMAGNVSEIPAFTGRTLFIDQESYLTSPYKDAPLRTEMAGDIASGDTLTQSQVDYLQHLRRPLYILSFHADREALTGRLIDEHGAPVFRQGFVAVFELLNRNAR